MKKTIIDLFEDSVGKYGGKTFLLEKRHHRFEPTTYAETRELALEVGAGLAASGIRPGDKVAILAEGSNAWIISELGLFYAGAVSVPLSVKLEESNDLLFRLRHAEVKALFVSKHQLPKIRRIRAELPQIELVVVFGHIALEAGETAYGTLRKLGRDYLAKHREEFLKIGQAIRNDDYATITYTSGTTADPKGVILTHRNYTANVEQSLSAHRHPAVLPHAHHSAARPLFRPCRGILHHDRLRRHGGHRADRPHADGDAQKHTGQHPRSPAALPAVGSGAGQEFPQKHRIVDPRQRPHDRRAVPAGVEDGIRLQRRRLPPRTRLAMRPATCRSTVRRHALPQGAQSLRRRTAFLRRRGALLDAELQRFFYAVGMPMFQGYGLSEATPVISTNSPRPRKCRFGSSGTLVQPLDCRILDEEGREVPLGQRGQIVVRGENVMAGYWKNPEATADTVRDGWLHTGDMGYLTDDGFLYVLGRFKSLLIASDGEKYSPEGMEEAIADASQLIDQIIVHNNQNPYTVAIVVPNRDELRRRYQTCGNDLAALAREVAGEIDAFRAGGVHAGEFPDRWLPSAVAIVDEAFTEQNGLVNSTMKVVRSRVEEHFRDRLDALYTPEGKRPDSAQNLASLKKLVE